MAGDDDKDKALLGQPTVVTTVPSETQKADGFGGKNITFIGGCALLINNITGPGLPALAIVFQTGGWLTCTILLILFTILSTLCSGFLAEAMTKVRGNSMFQGRVEYTYLAQKVFSRRVYVAILIMYMFSFQSSNIASVIESAQTMDVTLISLFNKTCALELIPNPGFTCVNSVTTAAGSNSPYGDSYVISLGFIIVLILTLPLGYMNLDDNIIVQIGSTILLVGICFIWGIQFFVLGFAATGHATVGWKSVAAFSSNLSTAIGVILFNFAWGVTVPSWINEMKPGVSVNKSLL